MKRIISCVHPKGNFIYGIYRPSYHVANMRPSTCLDILGSDQLDKTIDNTQNYPTANIKVETADWIFEVPNPFPFKGRTFINKKWADATAQAPEKIRLPPQQKVSLSETLRSNNVDENLITRLPTPLLFGLATTSTDPEDCIILAKISCEFVELKDGILGLRYRSDTDGSHRPVIHNHDLFEAVANNPALPDKYKIAMLIRPGAQGGSEITGAWNSDRDGNRSRVYEYLRRNSYIAGGHYAANMSDHAVRYATNTLQAEDIKGLRHLYYQRTYVRLAEEFQVILPTEKQTLTAEELDKLRLEILAETNSASVCPATLWGWNYGFDFSPTGYRLHASHQQIHQQYSLVPDSISQLDGGLQSSNEPFPTFSCGDLITQTIDDYREHYQSDFFKDYLTAIHNNRRMDGKDYLPKSLEVWNDGRVMLFVPKAQTSQWELQIMTLPDREEKLAGNILECDMHMRHSLDTAILKAQQALAGLGVRMVTSIEYPKRIEGTNFSRQPLLYALLPRLPQAPGAFTEAQLRFITGHYPEDFAAACRRQLT